MKIESWNINQSSTGRTEFTFATYDEIDHDTILEYLKLYDKSTAPIDLDFYLRMKKFAKEDEELHEFYTGKSPVQISEICDEIYNKIHKFVEHNVRSKQINWNYRQLTTGIEILRAYNIWWTPPTEEK